MHRCIDRPEQIHVGVYNDELIRQSEVAGNRRMAGRIQFAVAPAVQGGCCRAASGNAVVDGRSVQHRRRCHLKWNRNVALCVVGLICRCRVAGNISGDRRFRALLTFRPGKSRVLANSPRDTDHRDTQSENYWRSPLLLRAEAQTELCVNTGSITG